MAAASDKARFHLEQYVPELQEYEQKGIFTRDEITAITSKRSTFEHTLNARGSTPGDYARYATYEMNLDSLRKKRCKRLGIKATHSFNGQRTVFFVLDRATKKFPGDMGLWMQYINFCKKEHANKKLATVFTSVLRLRPRDWGLWLVAAKHYAETQGDIGTARSYMQRGLRFCKDERRLYIEYAKLEMVYLAKLAARRKVLGLDMQAEKEKVDDDENMITLPTITAEDINPESNEGVAEVNEDALKRLEKAPILMGALPIAIFDAAMKEFKSKSANVADDFFDMVATFETVPSTPRIMRHILDYLLVNDSEPVAASICEAKFELFAIDPLSEYFPPALGKALACIKRGKTRIAANQHPKLSERAVQLLLPYLTEHGAIDEDIMKVLEATIRTDLRVWAAGSAKPGRERGPVAKVSKLREVDPSSPTAAVLERLLKQSGLG